MYILVKILLKSDQNESLLMEKRLLVRRVQKVPDMKLLSSSFASHKKSQLRLHKKLFNTSWNYVSSISKWAREKYLLDLSI